MNGIKGRSGHSDAVAKGSDGACGDGFGSEIERMLMDRPLTRQHPVSGAGAGNPTGGAPNNTLDELMAELGMLRGERGELSLPSDRQYGRNGTRNGPRMSAGDGSLLGGSGDGALRPGTGTPRTSAAAALGAFPAAAGSLVLPPAKGAMPAAPLSPPGASAASPAAMLGPVRSQSPMSTRRSAPGVGPGACPSGGLQAGAPPSAQMPGAGAPPAGVLERQAQLEMRLEKMESREQQLMALISQLQQQVSTLTRAQQATQQQLAAHASSGTPSLAPSGPAPPPAPASNSQQPSPRHSIAAAVAAPSPSPQPPPPVSDEDFIKNDDEPSPEGSPKQRSAGPQSRAAAPQLPAGQQRLGTPPAAAATGTTPVPPASGVPGGGRPNKLVPQPGAPADWEADVSQLRKEVGALAATVVRLRELVATLVPGGPSLLSEEVSAQAAAAAQLKQNLTQIAMDVVSLHKGLTTLKQNTDRNFMAVEKSISDMQLQAQTNALSLMTSGPVGGGGGAPNAVAAALAATGGVSGSLEESLRSTFAKPAMRSLPAFNTADMGFMSDNAGVAAAVATFGGFGGSGGPGGGGGARKEALPANAGGGGLGAAWALLNSFEEQAAAEKEEQQKAAIIARQAVSIVDAKVKQVVMHVDRHMQMISSDVEERLRMYEQTIIRMAQQIDRVQRVLRELEGTAASRIVVRRGGKEVDDEGPEEAPQSEAPPEPPQSTAKENWIKAAAMATGRFVPQKEEKKPVARGSPHGYFRTPP